MTNYSTTDSGSYPPTYSSFLTSSVNLCREQSGESENVTRPCPLFSLSDRDEDILTVQSLRIDNKPDHRVSDVVSRAMAKCVEQVDRQIEFIEHEFKSINTETERRILNASRALDVSLNVIDNTLSDINDRNPDDFMAFDLVKQYSMDVDQLIDKRNRNINDFMDVLRDLERERTTLIENCYRQHMLDVKQVSENSFEWLYEKYLKNYNTIKLGNFRTYEELRFKLIQLSGTLRQNFALRAHGVKLKIKKNIGESFKNKFKIAAGKMLSDQISIFYTKTIDLVNGLNEMFTMLIENLEKQINFSIIVECSALLKTHSEYLEKMMDTMMAPLDHDEMSEDIHLVMTETVEGFNKTILDSGEHLGAGEFAEFNNEMFTAAIGSQQEKNKTVFSVQLFLSDVKDAIKVIDTVLGPATEIYSGHLKRVMDARNTVLVALKAKIKLNDTNLEVFQSNSDEALESLVQASNETDVRHLEQKYYNSLKYIKAKIMSYQEDEIKVVSNYTDLMKSEFVFIKSEVQRVLGLFPQCSIPEFKNAVQHESWAEKSIKPIVACFKTAVYRCKNALHRTLKGTESSSSDLLDDECAWTTLMNRNIDGRFIVATEQVENRTINDDIANKRIGEIEEHRYLLERHTNAVQESSDSLKEDTYSLYDEFILAKNQIHNNIQQYATNELSTVELADLVEEQKRRIDSVVSELTDRFKSHYENVQSKYNDIEHSTAEFKNTIKTFREGGNYGQDEAKYAIDNLNALSNTMFGRKTELVEFLNYNSYESIIGIKKSLSRHIKQMDIELDKKVFKDKYYAINRLMNTTASREILNLDQMLNSLRAQLQVFGKTFEKENVVESTNRWSELLLSTHATVDFLLETHVDIKALLKPHILSSVWNTNSKSTFISSKVTLDSTNTFVKKKMKFYDYCKTIVVNPGPVASPRFLANIYLSIFQYTTESQTNAADMAVTESSNSWINAPSDTAQIYHGVMEKVVKRCKTTILHAELVWIFKLLEFFDFLNELHAIESRFKSTVLAAYHVDSVTGLNESCGAFDRESRTVKKTSKTVREQFYFRLKPSHGHPHNGRILDDLLADFRRVNAECSDALHDVCARTETVIGQTIENYERQCPTGALKAATLHVKCRAALRAKLDSINIIGAPSATIDTNGGVCDAISEPLAAKIADERSVEMAVNTAKRFLQNETSTVFWPANERLWTDNVRDFSTLCRDRRDAVRQFNAAEKSKIVDWATGFVRDVEQVKEYHR